MGPVVHLGPEILGQILTIYINGPEEPSDLEWAPQHLASQAQYSRAGKRHTLGFCKGSKYKKKEDFGLLHPKTIKMSQLYPTFEVLFLVHLFRFQVQANALRARWKEL